MIATSVSVNPGEPCFVDSVDHENLRILNTGHWKQNYNRSLNSLITDLRNRRDVYKLKPGQFPQRSIRYCATWDSLGLKMHIYDPGFVGERRVNICVGSLLFNYVDLVIALVMKSHDILQVLGSCMVFLWMHYSILGPDTLTVWLSRKWWRPILRIVGAQLCHRSSPSVTHLSLFFTI